MLKQRVLTAIILIPLVLIGLFYTSSIVFQLILAAILLLAAWEWTNLAQLKQAGWRIAYLLVLALFFYLAKQLPHIIFIGLGVVWWLLASYFIITYQQASKNITKAAGTTVTKAIPPFLVTPIGILIFTTCFIALNFLRDQSQIWVVLLLLIVWLADIMAYFTGRQFGKHLLAPQISPKKTWEGFLGALFFVSICTLIGGWLLHVEAMRLVYLMMLVLCVVAISVVGDLFESYLKRQIGIKDSGQLLPGHGGLLDRIDSLVAAAPFFALGVFLLIK